MDCLRNLGRAALFAGAALAPAGLIACGPTTNGNDDDGPTPEDAYFELGQGQVGFEFVEDGDALEMELGGQGLLMFPMPVRGGGFGLPPDPSDYTHPKIPQIKVFVDIDGFNTGVGGHFIYLNNYRIPFTVRDDGDYQFNYVALLVPDDVTDYTVLDGREAHIYAELEAHDLDEPLVFERDVIVDTSQVPGMPLGGE